MRIETFHQRLRNGQSVQHAYDSNGKQGIIAIWRNEDEFVLTWEAQPEGDFFNEHLYERDEVHHFENIEGVLEFLKANKINPRVFRP